MIYNIQIVEELEKKQAQVRQELLAFHEAINIEIDSDLGEGDPISVEQDRIVSLIQESERQLEALNRTLQQARQGKYGICERCHQPIDPERLEAVPDTTFCIKCKNIIEHQRSHHIRAFSS
jgi:RNA polymerase-binding transcription factor DksA